MDCSCGHKNPDNPAYCEVCGTKLFSAVKSPSVVCIHCKQEFTLEQTVWCMCETDNPTYVCPYCERCSCPK